MDVDIHDPEYFGSLLTTSLSGEKSAMEMAKEFEIELLDDYLCQRVGSSEKRGYIEK